MSSVPVKPGYIASLPHRVRTAAIRLSDWRCGGSPAEIWPGSNGGINKRLIAADQQIVAEQWRWLHPASEHEESDAVVAWLEQFIDDVKAVESQRHFVRSY